MNDGFTAPPGVPAPGSPQFVIGCTFNPNSRNLDTQVVHALNERLAAGAQSVDDPAGVRLRIPDEMSASACAALASGFLRVSGLCSVANRRNSRITKRQGALFRTRSVAKMADSGGRDGMARGLEIAR